MSMNVSKTDLQVSNVTFNGFEEKSFDTDLVLPDYCPDIAVVLKCKAHPYVSSGVQNGDRFTVEGATVLRILYLGEDRKTVYGYETTVPYHVSFRINVATHHTLDTKCDYVNCRATGPRRLDIHGAIRIFLKTCDPVSVATVSCNPHDTICFQTKSIVSTVPVCEMVKSFSVSETIDIGAKAERLLYTDSVVSSCEKKVLTNKLILKGVLRLKAVYGIEDSVYVLHQEIPFSQIIDIPGLTNDWLLNVSVSHGERESYLHQSENGHSVLSTTCKLLSTVHASINKSAEVVFDAYSKTHPVICETEPLTVSCKVPSVMNKRTFSQTIDTPDGVREIVDMWGEPKSCELIDKGSPETWGASFLIGIIAKDETGHLGYYERMIDCECTSDEQPNFDVMSVNGSLSVEGMRIQIEAEQTVRSHCKQTLDAVSDIYTESTEPYQQNGSSIRIVYAHPGERLWDIAKRHHSSVKEIQCENDFFDEIVQNHTMLMIPLN